MPFTFPCEFCGHKLNKSIDKFIEIEPSGSVHDFSYELYRNLFQRFGFHFNLCEEYNVVRHNTPYTDEIEESVWGLSHCFRDYYRKQFRKLFPYFVRSNERYYFYIKSFGKRLFRDHVCAFKFLVFCGFLSELSVFCYRRALENTLNDAAKRLVIFFNFYIRSEFYSKVGWRKLQKTAKIVSVGYRNRENEIDFDPLIEKHFYSWDQIRCSPDFLQVQELPWIIKTANYLCLLNEDLDIFHKSPVSLSYAELEEQYLLLASIYSKIKHGSERNYSVQDAEHRSMLTENVRADFENGLEKQSAENLQLAEAPKWSKIRKRRSDEQFAETKMRKSYATTSGAQDVEETLLYFAQYIQEESENVKAQGTVSSSLLLQYSAEFDKSKFQNDHLSMQLAEYFGEIRKDLEMKRSF